MGRGRVRAELRPRAVVLEVAWAQAHFPRFLCLPPRLPCWHAVHSCHMQDMPQPLCRQPPPAPPSRHNNPPQPPPTWEEEPNCMMSRSSAECRYSLGTGRKKCTPRLLMPRISFWGSRPMGSSMRFTTKKMELPAGWGAVWGVVGEITRG